MAFLDRCADSCRGAKRLALHCLKLSGFETYVPRTEDRRIVRGRKGNEITPLFPSYAFVFIELQWHELPQFHPIQR